MSSVRGLLEERERVARVAVEELQAEADRILAALGEAEMVLERRVIAREELSEALAVPEEVRDVPAPDVPGQRPTPAAVGKAPVARSRVPDRREGMTVQSLSSEYRKVVELLEAEPGLGVEGMQVKEMTARLGLELTAAKIEGVRSSEAAGREGLGGADSGGQVQAASVVTGELTGTVVRVVRARRRLMSMVCDQ